MENTTENDLQKAIDDIARASGGGAGATPAVTAPTPAPMASAMGGGSAPVGEPRGEGGAPAEGGVGAEAAAPAVAEPREMGVGDVRDRALEELKPMIGTVDLAPILAKIELLPETKFKIYKLMIEATQDRSVLGPAYVTAKDISDDTGRAEALLYLVQMADKLQ